MSDEIESIGEDLKPTAGCGVLIHGMGQRYILDSYEDVRRSREEAEPGQMLDFTAYLDFSTIDKRVIVRLSVLAAAIISIEEWNDEIAEIAQREAAAFQEQRQSGPFVVELPGFHFGGGGGMSGGGHRR